MGDVITVTFPGVGDQPGFAAEYMKDDAGRIAAVSHPEWNFKIKREGDKASFFSRGKRLGTLPHDEFDTMLITWLMVNSPHLIDSAATPQEKESPEIRGIIHEIRESIRRIAIAVTQRLQSSQRS